MREFCLGRMIIVIITGWLVVTHGRSEEMQLPLIKRTFKCWMEWSTFVAVIIAFSPSKLQEDIIRNIHFNGFPPV